MKAFPLFITNYHTYFDLGARRICKLGVLGVRLLLFLFCGEMANRLEVIAYVVVCCVIAAQFPMWEWARAGESNQGSQMEGQRGPKYTSLWTSIELNRRKIKHLWFHNTTFNSIVFYYFLYYIWGVKNAVVHFLFSKLHNEKHFDVFFNTSFPLDV